MSQVDFDAVFKADQEAIAVRLDKLLPPEGTPPASLHGAMRYAVLGGGKRLRAVLCLASHRLFQNPYPGAAIDAGCAIECLHAYTLVHDDLPAIDNDDLRRGKPSCHKRWGEAVALLAGDALQALAFEILARSPLPPERAVQALRILSSASGSCYLVGGQVADIEGEGREPDEESLRFIHSRKTAELIAASLSIGGALAGAREEDRAELNDIGRSVGLAFQIIDDILDVEGSEERMGKALRKDSKRHKITYPARYGVEASRETARRLITDATGRIQMLGDEGYIRHIFAMLLERAS